MIIKNIYGFIGVALVALAIGVAMPSATVFAQGTCAGAETAIINCTEDAGEDAIWKLVNDVIKVMMGGVGVLALAGIVYGAVLYSSAGGSPEQVKKAKGIFINVAIGVIAFAAMFALLEFIVPGGVFN